MEEFRKIIGKNFSAVNRIRIHENGESYTLSDSVVFSNENDKLKFQIQTSQTGIKTITVKEESDLLIEGEYVVENIEYENVLTLKAFVIHQAEVFWDETKSYILGFIFLYDDMKLHFIRLADEINIEPEEEFYRQLANVQSYSIETI